jgi:hypothetical protein
VELVTAQNERDLLIPHLQALGIDYFNPVVENWTLECQAEEIKQREECDICLYVITPKMSGVYSIAEAVDDSNKRPKKTVLFVIPEDDGNLPLSRISFNNHQSKSLSQVVLMITRNGGSAMFSTNRDSNDSMKELRTILTLVFLRGSMKPLEIKTGRLIYTDGTSKTVFTISDGNYWAFDVLPDDLSKIGNLDIEILKLVIQSKNDSVFEILDRLELVGCILDGVLIDRFKCKELLDGLH